MVSFSQNASVPQFPAYYQHDQMNEGKGSLLHPYEKYQGYPEDMAITLPHFLDTSGVSCINLQILGPWFSVHTRTSGSVKHLKRDVPESGYYPMQTLIAGMTS